MLRKLKRYIFLIENDFKYIFIPKSELRPMMSQFVDKKKLIGVEIGVKEGYHASVMLRCLDIEKLYLIDPYEIYIENKKVFDSQNDYKKMLFNLKKFKNKIFILKDYSHKVSRQIPNNIDFVYIDGNHSHPFVDNDIENYYDKVKVGGLIGGHDFNNIFPDVIEAVVDFSVNNNLRIYAYGNDWWFVK